DFCLIPIGTGNDPSVAEHVAECARVLEKTGLKYEVCPATTVLAIGPWSAVSDAIRACHAAVHAKGAPRIATDIRIGTSAPGSKRKLVDGATGENDHKVKRVQEILGKTKAKL
ncbi:YkoF-like protein, partial [Peniophora sp. CONT]